MCGIACILHDDPQKPADIGVLRRMSDRIAHRGPDAEGFHVQGPVALASRRLAIIDLETGQQPISNEDGKIWVVFNGEIYNHPQLREELLRRGHQLRTRTDTETIVHLYEEHGDDLVHHLRGMFAFALWDSRRKRLLLARDRLGKKPLFYARTPGAFIAASEIKALHPYPGLDRTLDPQALDLYLTYGCVPAPATIHRGVRKLPPAHLMVVENGRVQIRRYWQVPTREALPLDEEECQKEVLRHLRDAVRMRMISDVPLGAFLSGGIDSSLIVALMQEISDRPVRTFAIGFPERRYSELPHARLVARHLGTEHHEFVVEPDIVDLLPRLVRAYDEPFADHSSVPSYYVARETRRHVTVALNGDGGDEAFAGYLSYLPSKIYRVTDHIPGGLRRVLASTSSWIGPLTARVRTLRRATNLMRRMALPPVQRYAEPRFYITPQMKQDLYTPEFRQAVADVDPFSVVRPSFERNGAPTLLDRMLAADLETYLPDMLLPKMDIASMANSLEARSPFLDHVLVEFAARIPARLKLRGWTLKYILRRTAAAFLPPSILARGKQGFSLPVDPWFRGKLRGYLGEMILGARALGRGYFREEGIRRLLKEQQDGMDHGVRLWALLMLEHWHREFVDNPPL
ncbi:MAG: asparagine synthase (glutamine-hydrolyzing) [Acidobacteriota bacterium]